MHTATVEEKCEASEVEFNGIESIDRSLEQGGLVVAPELPPTIFRLRWIIKTAALTFSVTTPFDADAQHGALQQHRHTPVAKGIYVRLNIREIETKETSESEAR